MSTLQSLIFVPPVTFIYYCYLHTVQPLNKIFMPLKTAFVILVTNFPIEKAVYIVLKLKNIADLHSMAKTFVSNILMHINKEK